MTNKESKKQKRKSIQYIQVAIDDAAAVQINESFDYAARVETSCGVVERTSAERIAITYLIVGNHVRRIARITQNAKLRTRPRVMM